MSAGQEYQPVRCHCEDRGGYHRAPNETVLTCIDCALPIMEAVAQGVLPAIHLLREVSACESVPTWMRAEADQVLVRVYGVQA